MLCSLLLLVLASYHVGGSITFWQTAPGNFARIQRGNPTQHLVSQNIISNSPQQHQPLLLQPVIREQKTDTSAQKQFSNIQPFVHFAPAPISLANDAQFTTDQTENNQLMNQFLQAPRAASVTSVAEPNEDQRTGKELHLEQDNTEKIETKIVLTQQNLEKINTNNSTENKKIHSSILTKIKKEFKKKLKQFEKELSVSPKTIAMKEKSDVMNKIKSKSGSFLDRLIEVMDDENKILNDKQKEPKRERSGKQLDELLEGLIFFEEAGLLTKFEETDNYEEDDTSDYIIDFVDEKSASDEAFNSVLDQEEKEVEKATRILVEQILELLNQIQGILTTLLT